MLHAVIGIGSNSTRLLVGDVQGGRIMRSRRMREGTRLFAGLDDAGVLSQESMLRTADAVARFAKAALDEGVAPENLHVIATSATRDAQNAGAFADLIEAMCGKPLQIISGEEEARLSFVGGAGPGLCGLVDIGGGSTEIATGGGGRPMALSSVQLGAVRLFGEVPVLSGEGIARAHALARERLLPAVQALPRERPAAWYGVGGTLTCLASVDMRLPAFDREAVDGHVLKRATVENWARRMGKMTAEERAALPGMLATRADIIAHGAVILWAAMEALDMERILVSNRTNLDGYLMELGSVQADSVQTVRAFYDASVEKEWARLEKQAFEFAINSHFIDRYAKPGARVLDVGGGPGRYALHLAARGVQVTLADLSPQNVAFAAQKAKEMSLPLRAVCADARALPEDIGGEYDVILLMGPLYHLLAEADRERAVRECLDRLRPGGVLCVAFISLIAGMIYAAREEPSSILWEGEDIFYRKIIAGEDFAGTGFTEAFMIEPSHIDPFMARFPLERLHLVASEGIAAPFNGQIMAAGEDVRQAWLNVALALCEREAFHSYAEHFLYIGRKKEGAQ